MTPAARRKENQRTFTENWLRCCHDRPWKAFALLWLVLFAGSLGLAFAGYADVVRADEPPGAQGVNYQWITMARGFRSRFNLTPEQLARFDPAQQQSHVACVAEEVPVTRAARIVATVTQREGQLGWPAACMSWRTLCWWDVTNPDAQFVRLALERRETGLIWWHQGVYFAWLDETGMRERHLALNLPGALVQFALPQFLAAAFVLVCAMFSAWRTRRRFMRDCCVSCAYKLDPAASSLHCPECGMAIQGHTPPRAWTWWLQRSTGALVRAGIVLAVLLVWIGMLGGTRTTEESSLFWYQMINARAGAPHDDALTTTTEYGWPVTLLSWQRQDWVHYDPERGQIPMPAEKWSDSYFSAIDAQVVFSHADPSVLTVINFNWPWIVFQLSLLIFLAALLASAEWLVRHVFRRHRAQPS